MHTRYFSADGSLAEHNFIDVALVVLLYLVLVTKRRVLSFVLVDGKLHRFLIDFDDFLVGAVAT